MKIEVNKQQLLDVLKKNRAIHEQEYNELQEDYLDAVTKELGKIFSESKKRLPNPDTCVSPNKPKCYLEDYDLVIGMLLMSIDETFTLDEEQYRNYVLNEWSWTRHFNISKAAYGK